MLLLLLSAIALAVRVSPPESCYVAQIAVIVDDVADFKYHRVVVAGIRKLEPAADATPGDCRPRSAAVVESMRRDIDRHLDSAVVKAPRTRAAMMLSHSSLDVVRSEIGRLAALAREHRGSFTRVEIVGIDASLGRGTDVIALPPLHANESEAAKCATDNATLTRDGAKYRWAC